MEKSPAGLDQREIDALKAQPEGVEIVSVRFGGADLAVWNKLRTSHPGLSATDLIKESVKLRYLADRAAASGNGLFLRQEGGTLDEVLDVLGYHREVPEQQQPIDSAVPTASVQQVRGRPSTRHKSGTKHTKARPDRIETA